MAARMCGIRVDIFSIGFGPSFFTWQRGDTNYRLAWFPLGGYVKMAGMIDESLDDEDAITGAPDEFMSKNVFQKAFTISAGVIMNFILAIVLYFMIALVWGDRVAVSDAVIGAVNTDYPAAVAGMLPGDLVIAVDGNPVDSWESMARIIHGRPDKEIVVDYNRDDQIKTTQLKTLSAPGPNDSRIGIIGIQPDFVLQPRGLSEAMKSGVLQTLFTFNMALDTISALVSGNASLKDIGGPIMIAQLSGEAARGGLLVFVSMIAFLSVNIGFINILPLPVMDGGHLVIILLEGIFRRPVPVKIKLGIQQVGFVLLMILTLVIVKNDIMRSFKGQILSSNTEEVQEK